LTIKSTSHTTERYFFALYILVFCMPVNIQLSKIDCPEELRSQEPEVGISRILSPGF
jgi:hypothetical protein